MHMTHLDSSSSRMFLIYIHMFIISVNRALTHKHACVPHVRAHEGERKRETDRQTYKQTERETHTHLYMQTFQNGVKSILLSVLR